MNVDEKYNTANDNHRMLIWNDQGKHTVEVCRMDGRHRKTISYTLKHYSDDEYHNRDKNVTDDSDRGEMKDGNKVHLPNQMLLIHVNEWQKLVLIIIIIIK